MNFIDKLSKKGYDKDKITKEVIKYPELIPQLLEGLNHNRGCIKFGCEKILRSISEQRPSLIYPYFDYFIEMLDTENNFLKWGAIIIIANLTAVDVNNRFEKIFDKYYSPISAKMMITAANIIAHSWKIVLAKPELADKISIEILKAEKAQYEYHGQLSPECNQVVCGHAINSLNHFYDRIHNKKTIDAFIKRQLNNTRKSVAKKAGKFMHKYQIDL